MKHKNNNPEGQSKYLYIPEMSSKKGFFSREVEIHLLEKYLYAFPHFKIDFSDSNMLNYK